MKVKVIKAGLWSLKGIENIPVELGEHDLKKDLAEELIENNWAEEVKEEEVKEKPKAKKKKAKK